MGARGARAFLEYFEWGRRLGSGAEARFCSQKPATGCRRQARQRAPTKGQGRAPRRAADFILGTAIWGANAHEPAELWALVRPLAPSQGHVAPASPLNGA